MLKDGIINFVWNALVFHFTYAIDDEPLNTRDFYRQIYSDVCPSGKLSCLREIMTSSFQLSLPRTTVDKVG